MNQHQYHQFHTPLEPPTMPHYKHRSWILIVSLLSNIFLIGLVVMVASSKPEAKTSQISSQATIIEQEKIILNDREEYACKLFTIREARDVLGQNSYRSDWPGALGAEYNGLNVSRCQYQAASEGPLLSTTFRIQVVRSEDISASVSEVFMTQVAGITNRGDITGQTYWNEKTKTLDVLTNDGTVWIRIMYTNDPNSLEVPINSITAIRTIIERLDYVIAE